MSVTKVEAGNERLLGDEELRSVTGGAKARPVKKFSTATTRTDPYKSFNFIVSM